MEPSSTTIAPFLLRNLISSIFISADKSLLYFSQKYKLLEAFRYLLTSFFLFFLRLLPSLNPPKLSKTNNNIINYSGNSGIARALSQLLSLLNEIPVSSRKYEVVRSLAEKLIDDNLKDCFETLLDLNRTVLSAAFKTTLNQLEIAVEERGSSGPGLGLGLSRRRLGLGRVFRAIRSIVGQVGKLREDDDEMSRSGCYAEKLAAELLWLAQKLVACGYIEEAVCLWASAHNLAWLALSTEPRLQGSLLKLSAFLLKQAKDIGGEEVDESKKEKQKQTKMKMLMSWIPLLCRGSNGTDAPVLSGRERAELEKVLEETIEMLEEEEEQEKVLSLWLHHFIHCPSSDWPNLHASYSRWCTASRKLLLLQ